MLLVSAARSRSKNFPVFSDLFHVVLEIIVCIHRDIMHMMYLCQIITLGLALLHFVTFVTYIDIYYTLRYHVQQG